MRQLCALLFLALAAPSCSSSTSPAAAPQSATHPMQGQQVTISLPYDSGELATIPAEDGKTTVLDFWAPTCEPCRETVPELVAKAPAIAAKGARLVLVGVLSDSESTEQGREVLASWGVNQPFLVDRSNASRTQLAVTDLPATLIIDGQGKLVWAAPKNATADDVVAAVP